LNDYSTAKFFPDRFPATIFNLLRPKTGIALLQDLTNKPRIEPFRVEDRTEQAHDFSSGYYDVTLVDGREIRVSGIPRHPKMFTAAQLLLQVQTRSQTVISRDIHMIHAGRRVHADDNVFGSRLSGRRFHLVQTMGLHYVEQYLTYFHAYKQDPSLPYPVLHQKQAMATGVWFLQPRID
jgi:hypothetical protein